LILNRFQIVLTDLRAAFDNILPDLLWDNPAISPRMPILFGIAEDDHNFLARPQ
jgi:hypothetical protein